MIKLDSVSEQTGQGLKPCPFCGGEAEIVRTMNMGNVTYRFFATCLVCGVETPRTARTVKQATEAWNRRTDNG
ncbi:MAG: Lar family restriction alleviation protein [Huintestinicola sp.]